jgi:hypothetical protein
MGIWGYIYICIYIYTHVLPEYNGTTGNIEARYCYIYIYMYSLFNDDTREYIYIILYIYIWFNQESNWIYINSVWCQYS